MNPLALSSPRFFICSGLFTQCHIETLPTFLLRVRFHVLLLELCILCTMFSHWVHRLLHGLLFNFVYSKDLSENLKRLLTFWQIKRASNWLVINLILNQMVSINWFNLSFTSLFISFSFRSNRSSVMLCWSEECVYVVLLDHRASMGTPSYS